MLVMTRWLSFVLLTAPVLAALKVQLSPSSLTAHAVDGFSVWQIADGGNSTTTTLNGITLTLSTPSDTFKGGRYKVVSEGKSGMPYYGEWVVGFGVATATTTTARALQLQISGLSAGTHTLQGYHNAWDSLTSVSTLDVAVNETNQQTGLAQTVRQYSYWGSATSFVTFNVASISTVTTVTYTSTGSGTDMRAYLNALEFDVPSIKTQPSLPTPMMFDEHVDADSGSVALSWKAASSATSYSIYVSTVSADDALVQTSAKGTSLSTSYSLTGIDHAKSYWWRVDTVTSDGTVKGAVWSFRPRILAFPGADGFGKYARGGRGGQVLRVTSLADYGTGTPVNGTFRWAVEQNRGPRIIIFDVGGQISLQSRLIISDRYITIAGQTAPGKGVVFTTWTLGLSGAKDVMIRHLRVRPGKASGETIDGMGMRGSNFAIFDHCSISWTIDESFSSRDAWNITLQKTLISEPLNAAGHKNYPVGTQHGYAASIGGNAGSFHHNLIAHAEGRSWSDRVTDGGAHEVDFIGNYYKPGASSTRTYDLQATYEDGLPGTQQYFCAGNMMLGVFTQDSTQVGSSCSEVACCYAVSISPAPNYTYFLSTPFMPNTVTYSTATEAYKQVTSDVGAWPVDSQDTRIVQETLAGTYTYVGSYTGKKGLIDDPADVGGLESWPDTTKPSWDTDSDGDGVPDWWDSSTGGSIGWTAMDGYLNWLSDPHQFIAPGASATIALGDLFKGFSGSTYTATTDKGFVSVSGSTATFTGPSIAAIACLTLSVTDSEGSKWSRTYGVAIICGLGSCSSTTSTRPVRV
ncbi:pectate lyase [Auriculariales sp. MPI-PUGE-AT-0066]|nr:pectate lyase [Auriculariales sp. MPI-PUGE-AT-0066]